MISNNAIKILVYDVAAEDGGGLAVLKDFYNSACTFCKNPNVQFTFLISIPKLESKKNVQILRFPWIKKSWVHRVYFDKIYVKKLLKQIEPNYVISLQNTILSSYKGKQYVYMHQSLQYCQKRFSFWKKEERATAIRQRLICETYKWGLSKAEHIYVQTTWIKNATKKWILADDSKITIVPVTVRDVPDSTVTYTGMLSNVFFYPARAEVYKNHQVVIDACKILQQKGLKNYRVLFTIDKTDSPYAEKIAEQTENSNITCIGKLPSEKVWEYYNTSILLFPSYLETCGLPLLEAKKANSIIIAANTPFANEALEGYKNAMLFEYDNAEELANVMELWIAGKACYRQDDSVQLSEAKDLLQTMMTDIIGEENEE